MYKLQFIRLYAAGLLFLTCLCASFPAHAVTARQWTDAHARKDGKGLYENLMYSQEGMIVPGFETSAQKYKENFLFTAAIKNDDGSFVIGGGMPARLLSFTSGKFTKISIQAKSWKDEIPVNGRVISVMTRLVESGHIIAGMTGGGDILMKKDALWFERLCLLPSESTWDLAVSEDGYVYAATGPVGQIFRIDPKTGIFEQWAQTTDSHIRFIRSTPSGRIFFGGGESGNLYELKGKDRIDVVYHFMEESISDMKSFSKGRIVAANKMRQPREKTRVSLYKKYFKQFSSLKSNFGVDSELASIRNPFDTYFANLSHGTLYFIGDDFRIETILSLTDEYIIDITDDKDNNIFVATGPRGRIYMIENPLSDFRKIWIAHDLDYRNVMAIIKEEGHPVGFLASGNRAVLFERALTPSSNGIFKTKVFSPGKPSKWGRLYHEGLKLSVFSRHGNTPVPDDTWMSWTKREEGLESELSKSLWRFIQLKFEIPGDGRFESFKYYYVEKNQGPVVKEIRVEKQAVKGKGPQRKITWQMLDPNDDKLLCSLWIKAKEMTEWIRLYHDMELEQNEMILYTSDFPDGRYQIKIMVSDKKSNYLNPMSGAAASSVFTIDNSRPFFKDVKYDSNKQKFSGKVSDTLSVIADLSFSMDGGEHIRFAPFDGIPDEKDELFILPVPEDMEAGVHTISFRAKDESENPASHVMQFSYSPDFKSDLPAASRKK
ncbi:hypothetical protein QUF76_00305 [Desulfobacterales bacterium HSG16]|nr:hypothetical protein [Desulfobacterales bacterium HSG16]